MNPCYDYSNKAVFVAGGTSGINLAIAHAFAGAGAVVGVASRDQTKVDRAVDLLSVLGGDAFGWSADVRNPEAVANAISEFAQITGGLDILVSGAAGNFLAPAKDLSPNGFKTVVDIDLLGTFNVMKAAYPHLRKPGANIISITAPQSYIPFEYQVHACAAKAGVDQVTRVLAKEWGPEGVRINSISPGPIAATEGMDRLTRIEASEDEPDPLAKYIPLRRSGTTTDIAEVALFLSSDAASYITGTVIPVDGGWGLSAAGGGGEAE